MEDCRFDLEDTVSSLQVELVAADRRVWSGEARMVRARSVDGELGILRGHAPLMALLGEGDLRVKSGGRTEHFHVEGGFLQVVDNVVTVLSERAEADGE